MEKCQTLGHLFHSANISSFSGHLMRQNSKFNLSSPINTLTHLEISINHPLHSRLSPGFVRGSAKSLKLLPVLARIFKFRAESPSSEFAVIFPYFLSPDVSGI